MCYKHNVLRYDQGEAFLTSLFRIYFGGFSALKIAPVLGTTLAQRLSGGINPRPKWHMTRKTS